MRHGQQRCLEYGLSYDSDTGAYLGEECKEMGSQVMNQIGTVQIVMALYSQSYSFGTNWAYGPDLHGSIKNSYHEFWRGINFV